MTARPLASVHTQKPRPGPTPALEPAPRPLRTAAPSRSHGLVRHAAGFAQRPACAATLYSPVGGAAAAPATGGGTKGEAGGRSAEGRGRPALCSRPAPPHPTLTASVSWLRCRISRLCARSSSRCRSVTSLSCRSKARSSKEGMLLSGGPEEVAPEPAPWPGPHSPCDPESNSLRRCSFSSRSCRSSSSACCADACSWGVPTLTVRPFTTPRWRGKGAVTHRVRDGPHDSLFQELQSLHHERH